MSCPNSIPRIAIDLLGAQSPSDGKRGIGRLTRQLVEAVARHPEGGDVLLYQYAGLPNPGLAENVRLTRRLLAKSSPPNVALEQAARNNRDKLDLIVLSSPFDLTDGFRPIPRPSGNVAIGAVACDLIPFHFPSWYFASAEDAGRYEMVAETIATYDGLFSISEATKRDFVDWLACDADRIHVVGAGVDGAEFMSDGDRTDGLVTSALGHLGISQRFVYSLVGADPRKNHEGLLRAFARLPWHLRVSTQLVITCGMTGIQEAILRATARRLGIAYQLILTGGVDNATLGLLMSRCSAFVFPSHYEGFGLPILEAMACGAPVIAGDNSSQPEIAGDAALLCDTHAPQSISAQIAAFLSDQELADEYRKRGVARAAEWTWDRVADRFLSAAVITARSVGRRSELPLRLLKARTIASVDVRPASPTLPEPSEEPMTRSRPDARPSMPSSVTRFKSKLLNIVSRTVFRALEHVLAAAPQLESPLRELKRKLSRPRAMASDSERLQMRCELLAAEVERLENLAPGFQAHGDHTSVKWRAAKSDELGPLAERWQKDAA
ncbi:glycosyltransferase family 4 protein [Stratiformator vulcanicus]|uniref:N-acetylgalactosamine-N, N'-diacetylbacillosaminyl-diphospho-undecaprenol 4-alpha-N-acetylgalactosaminyltransferase n=1 Tax=Stratiformator vulcanicus TaxID=2527980 RepID=A0A517QXJ1_9PLAN|nr:glycosyltransferase family 1 protein [Stratiformator vulcanicus]QDT36369.1 N-acetylgalactosamine-N,N'-diacetylbacillosaminyl-diphospho-undecaprenol 4-alpha-N-acetylgalactosaminyltransferase [Stratiformator vulcanicus]